MIFPIKTVGIIVIFWLSACVDREQMIVVPTALEVGTPITVFTSTTRREEADGTLRHGRSEQLRLMEMTVSIPPSHEPGELSYTHRNPNPKKNFTIAQSTEFSGVAQLRDRLIRDRRKNDWPDREVTIFVHGYNSTHPESAYRAAQIANDVELAGSILMYSWPSRGSAVGYAYDQDSAMFARDGLEETIRLLKSAGVERIMLVAHSMGTALAMETIRQADAKQPGWAAQVLNGGVVLMSPDLDIDVFENQIGDLSVIPQPFSIFVSEKDKILNISGMLRGTDQGQRLGTIRSAEALEQWPLDIYDLTEFTSDAASGHLVAATSPSLLALFNSARNIDRVLAPMDSNLLKRIVPTATTVIKTEGKMLLERKQRYAER